MTPLLGTGRFPQRLVPAGWSTVFVAGSVMHDDARRAEVLHLVGGAAWRDATRYEWHAQAWCAATSDDVDLDRSAIWLGSDEDWIVRHDADVDVCLLATATPRCVPSLDSVSWLTPGGALEPRGFEPTTPTAIVTAMKTAYDATSMTLCDAAVRARELRDAAMSAASDLDLVPGCRRLGRPLQRARLLFPPPGAVNEILQFVEDLQFWPEGDERSLWADDLLVDLDARKDHLHRAREHEVRRALRTLATSAALQETT